MRFEKGIMLVILVLSLEWIQLRLMSDEVIAGYNNDNKSSSGGVRDYDFSIVNKGRKKAV